MPLDIPGIHLDSPGFLAPTRTWTSKRNSTRSPDLPMRILCLGLSRTGTVSLRKALHVLGYRPYHGFSMIENPPDAELWQEALDAKFEGKGEVWEDAGAFDQVLGASDAVLDVPGSLFVEELVNAYPEAKVVVTVRDEEEWYRTIVPWKPRSLLERVYGWLFIHFDPAGGRYVPVMEDGVHYKYGNAFDDDSGQKAKDIFIEHVKLVEKLKPSCLVLNVKQGWSPLCEYLGDEVPVDESGIALPLPHLNDTKEWNDSMSSLMHAVVNRMLVKALGGIAVFATFALLVRRGL